MSFIKDAKVEVLSKQSKVGYLDALSFLFALFKTSGEYSLNTKQIQFVSNLEELFSYVNLCLTALKLDEAKLSVLDEKTFNSSFKFEIILSQKSSLVLMENFKTENYEERFFKTKTQKISFIKSIFIAAGTGTIILNADSQSYLLEFVFQDDFLCDIFCDLLAGFDILSKRIVRKTQYVVYLNKLDFISDFLALLNASNSVLNLQNESAIRNLRNNINRQNNCMEANINKTINASARQIDAIKTIQSTVGIESLDYSLQEICLLRLANPEESLEELVKLLNNKISKSGLNHRLNKIIKIASMLKD